MTDDIKVTVCRYPDRANLVLRYVDPLTGKQRTKSAGTPDEGEATKAAGVWQDELNTGRYRPPSRITWGEFRERYEREKLAGLSPKTQQTGRSALNHVERVLDPDRLSKLTTANLSRFQAKLREEGMKDVTLASVLRHLRPALAWAVSMGMLPRMPDIHPPKRPKGQSLMRGRPVTGEEFDRLLAAVPEVRPHDAAVWAAYLKGLWLSGLRLEESLTLSWSQDSPFAVDLTGCRPALRIYAEAEKGRRDRILPMTPDFAQWLLETPDADRHGRVFKLDGLKTGARITPKRVCRIVSKFGEKARAVVNWTMRKVSETVEVNGKKTRRKALREVPKYASAHDLRRSFGTRWASRVKPAVLQLLMRHSSIETTLRYYVAQNADDVADDLWATYGPETCPRKLGNTSGNNRPGEPQETEKAPADDSTETL